MNFTVTEEHSGKRLDVYLSEVTENSRSSLTKLIEDGAVTVNGRDTTKKFSVKSNFSSKKYLHIHENSLQ